MKRTVLINTSDMPVAARGGVARSTRASLIAEYFRDMTWRSSLTPPPAGEALREMSGRLEEMPGEEATPHTLPPVWPSSTSGPAAWPASAR